MINYFRNIRHRLADENKYLKYMRYAIGEVLLIVIGILLALYLNNLNLENSIRKDQVKILNELVLNLDNTIVAFERTIQTETSYLNHNLSIIDHFDQKKPYTASLDELFGTYFWTVSSNPVTGAYDYLKSRGLNLIENDSLRQNLSFLFESDFKVLKEENQFWANSFQENISYPYHVKNFRKYHPERKDISALEFAKPLNYQSLLNDPYFVSINTELVGNRRWNINSLKVLIAKIDGLKLQIKGELERLQSE
jgi:hypothetical protein